MKKMLFSIAALLALAAFGFRNHEAEILRGPVAELFNQTFTVDGIERTALVSPNSVPAPKEGSPLVLIFHGHGGTARFAANRFNIHAHWPEAVVVYPQGLPTVSNRDLQGQRSGWQILPGQQSDRDLKLFDAVLDWAKKKYKIDGSRIYAGGHSNGGFFSYVLWVSRGDKIAAFAPSAAVFGNKATNANPKPALLITGQGDNIVPSERQEKNVEAVLKLNQCETTGKEIGKGITLYKSKANADTAVYLHNGGHKMPDNTGEVMAKFFKEYRLR